MYTGGYNTTLLLQPLRTSARCTRAVVSQQEERRSTRKRSVNVPSRALTNLITLLTSRPRPSAANARRDATGFGDFR